MAPAILDEAVRQLKKKGWGTSSALQKSGSLKPGTNKPTAKGVKRGAMTQAQRRRNPP